MKDIKYEVTWTKILTLVSFIISGIVTYYTIDRINQRLDLRDAKFITADRNEKREVKEAYQRDRTQLLKILKHCEKVKTCDLPNDLAVASPEEQYLPETMLLIEAEKKEREENNVK